MYVRFLASVVISADPQMLGREPLELHFRYLCDRLNTICTKDSDQTGPMDHMSCATNARTFLGTHLQVRMPIWLLDTCQAKVSRFHVSSSSSSSFPLRRQEIIAGLLARFGCLHRHSVCRELASSLQLSGLNRHIECREKCQSICQVPYRSLPKDLSTQKTWKRTII